MVKKDLGLKKEQKEGILLIAAYLFFISLSFAGMAFQVFVNTDNPETTLGGSFEELSKTNSWNSEMYFVFIGISILFVSVLFYTVGRGILKRRNYSRITAIVFFSLGIVVFVILMFLPEMSGRLNFFWTSIFMILIHSLGLRYLLNKEVAKLFS